MDLRNSGFEYVDIHAHRAGRKDTAVNNSDDICLFRIPRKPQLRHAWSELGVSEDKRRRWRRLQNTYNIIDICKKIYIRDNQKLSFFYFHFVKICKKHIIYVYIRYGKLSIYMYRYKKKYFFIIQKMDINKKNFLNLILYIFNLLYTIYIYIIYFYIYF